MTTAFLLRARAVWLLGLGLVIAGLLPLLLFAGYLLLPSHVVASALDSLAPTVILPAEKPAWFPERLHPGLLAAGLGIGLIALGTLVTGRQSARIEVAKRKRADALRRVRQYRESPRIEPFLGPDDLSARARQEAGERPEDTRRRVA